MSLHAEWQNDWVCPYPFRVFALQSEHDEQLGQFSVTLAVLGLSVDLTWVYAPDAPLRAELRGIMADDSWLESSRVCMPYADYQALKADSDELAAIKAAQS